MTTANPTGTSEKLQYRSLVIGLRGFSDNV